MSLSMNIEERTILKRIDWNLVLVIFALNIVGLMNLYSATHGPHSGGVAGLFVNQIVWILVGWSVFFLFTFFDYYFVSRIALFVYFGNLAALVYVSLYGETALGAQRWIDLRFFRYQPSETMKLCLIVILAKFLAPRTTDGPGMGAKDLFWPLVIMGVPFALVVKQPDLGTALMLTAIGGTLVLFMKVRFRILATLVICALISAPIAWTYGFKQYQKDRIHNFLEPENDPLGSGYNSTQSKIAVGSGKFLGKGFRKGTQSQLEFLPERHTDFIYSVLSEEHGFVGSTLVLALFCTLFLICIRIASTAREKFGALLVVGSMAYIFWHMFINIGMVIGVLPIVGVPLPLLSYGGSGMLTTMIGLGLVSSVAYRRFLF